MWTCCFCNFPQGFLQTVSNLLHTNNLRDFQQLQEVQMHFSGSNYPKISYFSVRLHVVFCVYSVCIICKKFGEMRFFSIGGKFQSTSSLENSTSPPPWLPEWLPFFRLPPPPSCSTLTYCNFTSTLWKAFILFILIFEFHSNCITSF